MNIPTDEDWGDLEGNLDLAWAYRKFHGKTLEEAVKVFEDNAICCWEDLMYMPGPVFCFYIKACITYLMSDAAKNDGQDGSSFVNLIEFKSEHQRDDLIPIWSEIEPVLKGLVERQEALRGEWTPNNNFRVRIHEIVKRGFEVSFETDVSEVVPRDVTLNNASGYLGATVPFPVAVQILRNSNVFGIDATSTKPDIFHALGSPNAAGGGNHPEYGFIPYWMRYDRPECVIRFGFDEDCVSTVTFTNPNTQFVFTLPEGLPAAARKVQAAALGVAEAFFSWDGGIEPSPGSKKAEENAELKRAQAFSAWDALFEPPPPIKESNGDVDSKGDGS